MYLPRTLTFSDAHQLIATPTGSDQGYPEKRAEERLGTAIMAPWNVTLYVGLSYFSVNTLCLCLRLSQLIGSTLALEYMRAGASSFFGGSPPNRNLQNMLLRWDQLLSSSIFCSLDF